MPLIYAGIDEAGYGPMLGPLCVGLAVFRVDRAEPDAKAPDLWALLKGGVCRSLAESRADKKHRIPIADSKKLKLSNQSKTRHPLYHLERAALALLASAETHPHDDTHLFAALNAQLPNDPWYASDPTPLPLACDAGELKIAANVLATAMRDAGVHLEELSCSLIGEREFNHSLRHAGNKADITARAVGHHLRTIRERWGGHNDGDEPTEIRIACDRLGGRASYTDLLTRELPGIKITPIAESPEISAYTLGTGPHPARILFMTESESAHLPVAVASIAAKLTRELSMRRLNAHFAALVPELKPTAGYVTDARRWLHDVRSHIDAETRKRLVRLA